MAVMHGANAPLLQRMIEKEIRKERQVLKGEAVRDPIMLEDAVPGKFQKRKDKFKIRPTFHFCQLNPNPKLLPIFGPIQTRRTMRIVRATMTKKMKMTIINNKTFLFWL